jgi:hypothetical protein
MSHGPRARVIPGMLAPRYDSYCGRGRVSPSMAARERVTDPVGPDYFDLVVTPIGPNRNTIVELLAPDNRGADRR